MDISVNSFRLVRDLMTIGVPVCRASESCGPAAARLAGQASPASAPLRTASGTSGETCEVCVVLDEDGMACGWLTLQRIEAEDPLRLVGEIADEDIPTVPPDIPAETAAQIMRDRGVAYLFLMHDWPGEPRPSAVISLRSIEAAMVTDAR